MAGNHSAHFSPIALRLQKEFEAPLCPSTPDECSPQLQISCLSTPWTILSGYISWRWPRRMRIDANNVCRTRFLDLFIWESLCIPAPRSVGVKGPLCATILHVSKGVGSRSGWFESSRLCLSRVDQTGTAACKKKDSNGDDNAGNGGSVEGGLPAAASECSFFEWDVHCEVC